MTKRVSIMSNIPSSLDAIDRLILGAAYHLIGKSLFAMRTSGRDIYNLASSSLAPDGLSPTFFGSRIQGLLRKGLLAKDEAKSTNTTKIFVPTSSGLKAFKEMNSVTP